MDNQETLLQYPSSSFLADVRKHTATETITEKEITRIKVNNPNVKRRIVVGNLNKETVKFDPEIPLYLTNNRTIQQLYNDKKICKLIIEAKIRRRGEYSVVRSEPTSFCRSMKTAKVRIKENGIIRDVKFYRMFCNSWNCPTCCKRKANMVRREIIEVSGLNNLYYHLVFTLDGTKIPYEYKNSELNDTHKYITKIFNHFLTLLRREKRDYVKKKTGQIKHFDYSQLEKELKYIWIIEFQKDTKNAHMHILLNQFLPIEVIRDLWMHVGGGVEMFIERVKTVKGLSIYVTKYISKGLNGVDGSNISLDCGFKYYERRYAISNSCERKPKNSIIRLFDILPTFDLKAKFLVKQGLDWIVNELNNVTDEEVVEVSFDT
ncbi:hypothetical protein GYA37_03270 [candidate division WWE3 bacterium]|uniref:Replication-associated protein ORF2/G2P domain-containing protein n=1 Tax=candidate division WWE3 bacterium TaxID=2053526 RepID=A0A7X9E7B5_UNCKA|nr:hypothetical protein [candidate division WWE3 bacterium]